MTSGGSAASLEALVAARESAGNPEKATVYMSDQSHSALVRAARIIGIRSENERLIPTDARFRLDSKALARAVEQDRAEGFSPVAVCANAGASSTGAIDPLETMADFASQKASGSTSTPPTGVFQSLPNGGSLSFVESSARVRSAWMPINCSSSLTKRGACS